ncbi:MAG: anti-sigma factor [Bacillota bacterium]|nr:anti-sigma factor [Bacillota bacterium]
MSCPEEMIELIHEFLDGEIEPGKEIILRNHLQCCQDCENLFNELNTAIALMKGNSNIKVPEYFTEKVMAQLPKEKKNIQFQHWLQRHPFLAAASLFLILMIGSGISTWNQNREFSVSKQKNLIIKNHTVIVPKGKVVRGDVIVKNGNLKIEGEVQGDVTVINGEKYMASAGHVTGEIKEVNEVYDWIWYNMKKTGKNIIGSFGNKSR